jgi:predicted nucleic acid-binding protein
MSNYTVDASVAIKWFVPEPLQANAWTLARQPESLVAPEFLLVEVANIAWKKAVRREISRAAAIEIVRKASHGVDKLFPSDVFVRRALEIGLELNHSIYDCMYLAVAELTGNSLVSADTRLLKAVAGSKWKPIVLPLSSIPPLSASSSQ